MDLTLHPNELDFGQTLKNWNLGACKSVVITEKDILGILRKEKRYLQKNFGLLSIGLFGSYSKGNRALCGILALHSILPRVYDHNVLNQPADHS